MDFHYTLGFLLLLLKLPQFSAVFIKGEQNKTIIPKFRFVYTSTDLVTFKKRLISICFCKLI